MACIAWGKEIEVNFKLKLAGFQSFIIDGRKGKALIPARKKVLTSSGMEKFRKRKCTNMIRFFKEMES